MNTEKMAEVINELTQTLESTVNTGDLDAKRLVQLIPDLMELVEKYPELKGRDKKRLVIEVLRKFVNNKVENEDKKTRLLELLDEVVPDMVDIVVDASKGKLNVNAITQVATGCLGWCGGKSNSTKKH